MESQHPSDASRSRTSLEWPENISAELLEVFTEEADDHIKVMYAGLSQLQTAAENREALQNVRRAAHTLKGAAGAVGLQVVCQLAHRMEDLLDRLYDQRTPPTAEMLGLLLTTTDALHDLSRGQFERGPMEQVVHALYQQYSQYLTRAVPPSAPAAPPVSTPAATPAAAAPRAHADAGNKASAPPTPSAPASRSVAPAAPPSTTPPATRPASAANAEGSRSAKGPRAKPFKGAASGQILRVPAARLDELVRLVSEWIISRTTFEQKMGAFDQYLQELQPALERLRGVCHEMETRYSVEALRGRRGPRGGTAKSDWLGGVATSGTAREEFDALEFDRYTDFHLMSRTLSEATNDITALGNDLRTVMGDFESLLSRQARLSRETQDRLLRIRMLPLATLADRLNRAVRNVALSRDKMVRLVFEGEDTELDKTVLEEMADPLLHLVRNAVDHGVEMPQDRKASGKAEEATVQIAAFQQGTQVIIRISDDGRGIDTERIRAAIVAKGLVPAQEASSITPQELTSYIFVPGLSTAKEVSEISGRGVGMDVVRDRVQKLNGSIDVESQVGAGTTFVIRLPLTLAVTRALMVEMSHHRFAVPMQSVTQILRIDAEAIAEIGGERLVRIGEATFPLINLAEHLGLPRTPSETTTLPVLILRVANQQIAVAVDRILAGRDVVVKGLGNHLRHVPGLLGVTLLGDGTVVPILDPADFARQRTTGAELISSPPSRRTSDALTVMIVDDSVSVRRVMSNLLKANDIIPITAKDGVDALETLSSLERVPDLFLLDIEMPRMDGYELLNRLRSEPTYESTPIVMVTSRAGDKHRRKAIEMGATDYLIKPYRDDILLSRIRQLVAQSRETVMA